MERWVFDDVDIVEDEREVILEVGNVVQQESQDRFGWRRPWRLEQSHCAFAEVGS